LKKSSEIIYTTNAVWVRAIYDTLLEAGLDSNALFKQFDIPLEVSTQSDLRVDVNKLRKLWTFVTESTGRDDISLNVTRHVNNTSNILTILGGTSKDLIDATQKMTKFISAATTGLSIQHYVAETFCIELSATATGVYVGEEALDAVMARITHLASMVYNPPIRPLRLLLTRAEPKCLADFERFFDCPLKFNQSNNLIEFSLESARLPFKTANLSLSSHLERYLKEYIEQHLPSDTTNPLINEIFRHLAHMLPEGKPGIADMAKRLNMSQRTLQRKLKEEGVSFQALLNKIRLGFACDYLEKDQYNIETISDFLGFSSYTSFIRFFKAETSLTPKEFLNNSKNKNKKQI